VKKEKPYAVRRSKTGKGLGLFATARIRRGQRIVEYTGKHITTAEADRLKTRYLFEIDSAWTIDGSARSNIARYINHSCAPNAESELDDSRVFIQALRTIEPGEEITFDYGEEYFDEFIKPHGCLCDSCHLQKARTSHK
jgi:SET domain-containing protein